LQKGRSFPIINPADNSVAQQLLEAFVRFRRVHWRQSPIAGLTHSELLVLVCIKSAVPVEAGLRVSEISSLLKVAAPTITQQLNNLAAQGLVEKHRDPADRRAVRIRLTGQGECAMQAAAEAFSASITGLVGYLGAAKSRQLAELLGQVFTYFQEVRAGTP